MADKSRSNSPEDQQLAVCESFARNLPVHEDVSDRILTSTIHGQDFVACGVSACAHEVGIHLRSNSGDLVVYKRVRMWNVCSGPSPQSLDLPSNLCQSSSPIGLKEVCSFLAQPM